MLDRLEEPIYLVTCGLFVICAVLNHRRGNHAAGGVFMLAAAMFFIVAVKGA